MRPTTRRLATLALALSICPLSATAWDGPPAGLISIADASERAESGDYMVVEGVVIEKKSGTYFEIEDATGRMYVVIPDFLIREEGEPEHDELIRVAGKYDHKKLDKSVTGLRVMTLWRGEQGKGARGATPTAQSSKKSTGANAAGPAARADRTRGAESSASADPKLYRPTADPETVEKLARARQEWLAAVAELEDASSAYARALYQAGDDGTVDPALVARNDAAEARVSAASDQIPGLVEEARSNGVSDDVLRLYIQMTTRNP